MPTKRFKRTERYVELESGLLAQWEDSLITLSRRGGDVLVRLSPDDARALETFVDVCEALDELPKRTMEKIAHLEAAVRTQNARAEHARVALEYAKGLLEELGVVA